MKFYTYHTIFTPWQHANLNNGLTVYTCNVYKCNFCLTTWYTFIAESSILFLYVNIEQVNTDRILLCAVCFFYSACLQFIWDTKSHKFDIVFIWSCFSPYRLCLGCIINGDPCHGTMDFHVFLSLTMI